MWTSFVEVTLCSLTLGTLHKWWIHATRDFAGRGFKQVFELNTKKTYHNNQRGHAINYVLPLTENIRASKWF